MEVFRSLLLILLLLSVNVTNGQDPGSNPPVSALAKDTTHIGNSGESMAKKAFPVRMLLLSGTLITYGITSISDEGLIDINEEGKEELWLEHPHGQIHIDNYLQWAPAAAVYGLNALGIKGSHDFRDRTIIYGLSTTIMASVVFVGKNVSRQLRPDGSDKHSFPSGHTATAFAAAEFLRKEYEDVSPWYGVAGYAIAAATGYLRMYNNKHWLGDVVAGAGVGILSTDLAYYLYPSFKKNFVKEKKGATEAVPFYNQGVVGISLVHQF
jgi:hypothetical protein